MTWFVSQVVFAVHVIGIVEGGIKEGVDIFHEGASHFPFAFVSRLWRRDEHRFFGFTRATIFPSRKLRVWAIGGGGGSVDGQRGVVTRGATNGSFKDCGASVKGMSWGPFLAAIAPIGSAIDVSVSQVIAMGAKAGGKS